MHRTSAERCQLTLVSSPPSFRCTDRLPFSSSPSVLTHHPFLQSEIRNTGLFGTIPQEINLLGGLSSLYVLHLCLIVEPRLASVGLLAILQNTRSLSGSFFLSVGLVYFTSFMTLPTFHDMVWSQHGNIVL